MEHDAAIILSESEMHFPPSFFDIMVHLTIHLVREVRLSGPVYLRWIYPIERYMKILKGYSKNLYRPEASIVERYVAEESIEFCNEYFSQTESVGLPKSRHDDRDTGKGTLGINIQTKMKEDVRKAHLCVLNNIDSVLPYLDDHKDHLKKQNLKKPDKWILNEHNRCFIDWFKEKVYNDGSAIDTLKWLAGGTSFKVFTWCGYDINKYSFYTESQDDKSTVQNSGVTIIAEATHFSSSKDKNTIKASMNYFGVIYEIWELDYSEFRIPVFKCKWVDNNNSVKNDPSGLTFVDRMGVKFTDEPFIMAYQEKQVFYIEEPSDDRWSAVLNGRTNEETHEVDEEMAFQTSNSTKIHNVIDEKELYVITVARDDHE